MWFAELGRIELQWINRNLFLLSNNLLQTQWENVLNQLMQTSQAAIRAAESANALAAQIASSSSSSTSGPSADDGRTTKELYKLQ